MLRWNPILRNGVASAIVAAATCAPTAGAMPAAPPPTPTTPAASLSSAWETTVDDTPAPYVTGSKGGFVVTTRAGRVTARAAGPGAPRWQIELGSLVLSEPVASGGGLVVITGAASGQEALVRELETGRIVSRVPVGPSAPFLSAVEGGIVLADPSAGAAGLALIDPSDGSVRWKTSLASVPSAPAARCGDLIVVGGADGSLTAVAVTDGSPRWSRSLGGAISTAPLCSGRRAWVGSADNHVHALTLRRRGAHRRWSFLTGGDVAGNIVLHGSRVLFSSFDTYLYALEAGNGHLAWKVHLGRRPQSRNVLMGDLLIVAPLNSERIEVFHLPDGTQTAALSLAAGKDRFVTPPSSADGVVVIGAARYGEETSRVVGVDPASIPPPAPPAAPR